MEFTERTGLLDSHRKSKHVLPTTSNDERNLKGFSFYLASGLILLLFMIFLAFSRTVLTSTPYQMSNSQGDPLTPNSVTLNSISHPMTPSSYWGVVKKPYPTGAFWTNLVVENGDGPVAVLPYGVKCIPDGVQISYGPTRRSVTNKWIRDTFDVDIQVATVQPYANRGISAYDEISATMSYDVSGGSYKVFLVKGSPFLTLSFQGSTPIITSSTMHITKMELYPIPSTVSLSGLVYIVTLGNFQKWLIYSSDASTPLVWKGDTIVASSPTHGIIRCGILPSASALNQIDSLLPYLATYPIGVDIDIQYSVQGKQTLSTLQYRFKLQNSGTSATSDLLMLALPHHMEVLTNPNKNDALSINIRQILHPIWTMKGKMTPVIGSIWTLQYTLFNPGWNYDLEGRVIPTNNLNIIGQALQFDVLSVPPYASDPYTFGKQCARLASLALIADNLGIADARQRAIAKLENTMTPWLVQSNSDTLVYDTTYGGIIPTSGVLDKQTDYGSGWYNDHHFHYGYFIYTSSILSHLDSNFYQSHKLLFDSLVKDICNSDKKNKDYPYVRHKDFFDGHSWASGLFQQANGKSQESSSEAANAYYAVKLYADASNDVDLSHFAQLMLTMEIQAIKYYWHINNFEIYDAKLGSSRMIGNVGGFDVTTSTWFGSNLEYVHGINIMPITPLTALLFDHSYVSMEWPVLETVTPPPRPPFVMHQECSLNENCAKNGITGNCCPTPDDVILACCDGASGDVSSSLVSDEWASLLYAVHAGTSHFSCRHDEVVVIDQKSAWTEMLTIKNFGSGNSKSNSLYWVASRANQLVHMVPTNQTTYPIESCSTNSACDAAGIIGDCCPTLDGTYLGCCPVDIAP